MSDKNKLIQSLQKVWEQTSVPARISVLAVGLLSIALIVGVAWWSMQPLYIPLATNLNPQKAGEIRSLLDENGIANKMNFSGSGILVDQSKWNEANQLVSHMIDPGQMESDPMAESIITDPSTKDHRLIRDLEMRLEKTIGQLKPVESARVHLGIPKAQPFIRDRRNKTASVTIKMRPGVPLSRKLSSGVVSLVANSVEGLDPANVNLLDTEGNTYLFDESTSGGVSAQLEDRRQIEREKAEKAESMLASILGLGRAVVRVTADIDFTKIEKSETTYDPSGKVPRKEIIESTKGTAADPLSISGSANQRSREIVSSQEKKRN